MKGGSQSGRYLRKAHCRAEQTASANALRLRVRSTEGGGEATMEGVRDEGGRRPRDERAHLMG